MPRTLRLLAGWLLCLPSLVWAQALLAPAQEPVQEAASLTVVPASAPSSASAPVALTLVPSPSPSPSLSPQPVADSSASLPPELRNALRLAGLPEQSMAVWVQAIPALQWLPNRDSPQLGPKTLELAPVPAPVLRIQADRPMNPASVMKLVTTSVALQSLGADFRWQTSVWRDGAVRGGVLYGDLIVRGGGDPYLPSERVQDLIGKIRAQGIGHIQGDIVLDQSLWQLAPAAPADFDGKPERPYNAQPEALMLAMQALELRLDPQGQRAQLSLEPAVAGLNRPSDVALSAAPCVQADQALGAYFPQPGVLAFRGAWPRSCGAGSVHIAYYPQPQAWAGMVFAGLWQAAGGSFSGAVRVQPQPSFSGARRVLRFPSLPLEEVAGITNVYSNNPMAKQIFLSLPVWAAQPRRLQRQRGSWRASQKWMQAWWQQHLPGQALPIFENGSGLSRIERISAAGLAALMQQSAASPQALALIQGLPLAGREGTAARLARRAPQNRALGQARLKTGTLDDVKALAAYVRGADSQVYAVVGIINHPRAAAGQAALDALLDWAAGQAGRE